MKIRDIILATVVSSIAVLSTQAFAENGLDKPNTTMGGSQKSQSAGSNGSCSTVDLSVFEEADEQSAYSDLGYSRGDIKYLYANKYDPKSEAAISGNIVKVLRVKFPDENCYLTAVVKTDNGDFLVNLGPVWFADENNVVINEGDSLQVKGSKIRTNGRYIIIASELKKGVQTVSLRNLSGNPVWGTPKAQKGTNY